MPNFDILGKKKYFFSFSILFIAVGVLFFFINGLQYDVQFSGGTVVQIEMEDSKFDENDAVTLVREVLDKESNAYKLKTYNPDDTSSQINILKVQISNTEGALESEQFNKLLEELQNSDKFNVKENPNMEVQNIQPAIGKELRNDGFLAVAISALLITFYIAIRFKLMSGMTAGITAIMALLHDVFIMMSVYTIFKIPINETFIAAILTIVGYSINDTIIIYDRIRENMGRMRRTNIEELVNTSIIQTLTRSINTVVTVLICIITLYVFASINNIDSIKQFSFPLIIGLTSGGYSSIFIASPLWVIFKNRQNRNKKLSVKTNNA
jgi:preprotein translocase subunit SecF